MRTTVVDNKPAAARLIPKGRQSILLLLKCQSESSICSALLSVIAEGDETHCLNLEPRSRITTNSGNPTKRMWLR
jgi:hypothetical protein